MIKVNGEQIELRRFPDGTELLSIDVPDGDGKNRIDWYYEPGEEMSLYYIAKHMKQYGPIFLYMPYIPNARMDRTYYQKDVFTLKYFCEFINSIGFDYVSVRDPHSNVSIALLDNILCDNSELTNINSLVKTLLTEQNDYVFYPDEGAMKRYSKAINFPNLFGVKTRYWETGKIKNIEIFNCSKTINNVLIVDDICSYGGTFLQSAKKLKEVGAKKIWLYVTHCENSILKGELIHSGLIEKIYTTNSIFTKKHPLIDIIHKNILISNVEMVK